MSADQQEPRDPGGDDSVANPGISQRQIADEQTQIDLMYSRRDQLLETTTTQLDRAQAGPIAGTPGSQSEREALVAMYTERLATLRSVEDRLCFGRLDLRDNNRIYIGRIGLADEQQEQLLLDWRADAAAAFYQATAVAPTGVIRRRHIALSGRTVTDLDDEVLDVDAMSNADLHTVTGSDALLTSLDAGRTGSMRDIVTTIQAEQDVIIRSELPGVLVVQGGPGTGKTVVALHRVAYLLYAHRNRIERSGALVIGPNRNFMSYIDRVLPALGETGVLMHTLGQLHAGIEATRHDQAHVQFLKGSERAAEWLRALVRHFQRIPNESVQFRHGSTTITMRPADVQASIRRARDTRRPHNVAREVFAKDLLRRLARRLARALSVDENDDETVNDLVAELREERDVRREINLCWMPRTPEELLTRFLTDETLIASCAPQLSQAERQLLVASYHHHPDWSIEDVALLDELATLLGDWNPEADRSARAAARERQAHIELARRTLADSEAGAMISAANFADRYAEGRAYLSVAERAAADRTWRFGHIVVDEAQELSPMQWRAVFRRSSNGSLTVVGDTAQTSSSAGVSSWEQALSPHAADRWRIAELTVNYRTPRRIAELAEHIRQNGGLHGATSTAVRDGRWAPELAELSAPGVDPSTALHELLTHELATIGDGTVAVIRDSGDPQWVDHVVAEHSRVTALDVQDAKGLEFDSVIIVRPDVIVQASSRPAEDLYVAVTRPTQRLVIATDRALPELLASFESYDTVSPSA